MTQGNELIEAAQRLTLNEKRTLLLGISKINPMRKEGDPLMFSVTVDDWLEHFPNDSNPWSTLRRASLRLLGRYVTFRPCLGITEAVSWFDMATYRVGEGRIDIEFGRRMSIYLFRQIECFTSIPLQELTPLRSLHSIRLYELLKQYKHTGQLKVTVDDFRHSMNCSYPRLSNLKARVIEPALKEIRGELGLEVTLNQLTRGRKVTHFIFEFSPETRGRPCRESPVSTDPDMPLPENPSNGTRKSRDIPMAEFLNDRSWAE